MEIVFLRIGVVALTLLLLFVNVYEIVSRAKGVVKAFNEGDSSMLFTELFFAVVYSIGIPFCLAFILFAWGLGA